MGDHSEVVNVSVPKEFGLEFRPATLADRDEVLGELSSNVYFGHDYLPCFYQRWLYDDRHEMIVAVDKNSKKIVGLDTIGLFDGGKTVVFQALRVHSQYQGRGIAKKMSEFLSDRLATHYPNVKRLRVCTQDHNYASRSIFQKKGYTQIAVDGFAMATLTKPFSAPVLSELDQRIRRVDARTLWDILDNLEASLREELIHANMILIDWMPYEISLENLKLMEREEEMTFALLMGQNDAVKGLAVSTRSQRVSGVNLFAAIYTRGNVDAFVSLAKYVVTTCWHGCTCFCLSYDAILHQRALLQNCHESDCLEADFTFSPAITLLSEATKPHLDFTADYVGGCEVVLEKNISL
eukprot:gene2914-5727_t